MKTMLITPSSFSILRDFLDVSGPPLGLGYIASYLRERGEQEVKIVDSATLRLTHIELAKEVRNFEPNVVGVSFFSTPSFYDAVETVKTLRKQGEDALIVAGGVHVTFTAKQTLNQCEEIDVVVRGEGERVMLNLLQKYETGNVRGRRTENFREVRGITFKTSEGEIVENPGEPLIKNLNSLPFPAFDLLPMERYRIGKKNYATMITSRGCPFKCIYCSSSRLYGSKWRYRDPDNVVEEMAMLNEEFKVNEVEFLDDNFMLNPARAEKIAEKIKERDINVSWTCSSRVDTISRFPKILKKLKDVGCHAIYVGIESGSQRILDLIGKKISLNQAVKAVKAIKKAGMDAVASFVLGLPTETKEEIKKTIRFAKELNPDYAQFTLATPYPGTPLFDFAVKNKLLIEKDWRRFDVLTPVLKIEGISSDELAHFLRKAYASFYLRPKYVFTQIRKRNFFLFKKIIKAFITYVKEEFPWIITKRTG